MKVRMGSNYLHLLVVMKALALEAHCPFPVFFHHVYKPTRMHFVNPRKGTHLLKRFSRMVTMNTRPPGLSLQQEIIGVTCIGAQISDSSGSAFLEATLMQHLLLKDVVWSPICFESSLRHWWCYSTWLKSSSSSNTRRRVENIVSGPTWILCSKICLSHQFQENPMHTHKSAEHSLGEACVNCYVSLKSNPLEFHCHHMLCTRSYPLYFFH